MWVGKIIVNFIYWISRETFPGKFSSPIFLAAKTHQITCFMAVPSNINIPDNKAYIIA